MGLFEAAMLLWVLYRIVVLKVFVPRVFHSLSEEDEGAMAKLLCKFGGGCCCLCCGVTVPWIVLFIKTIVAYTDVKRWCDGDLGFVRVQTLLYAKWGYLIVYFSLFSVLYPRLVKYILGDIVVRFRRQLQFYGMLLWLQFFTLLRVHRHTDTLN